ncbi:MAG: D-glycero-beta-D-manno-heptose 1-phosphate adenylyltransferase [Planctomycetota bacterium]
MHPLARTLTDLPSLPILVVGDLVLDCYIDGSASRVSPEAPVLVFETGAHRYLLGGACNVAANLVALGAKATVLGVVGADAAGGQLLDLMQRGGIETDAVVRDASRPTTKKTRYVSRTAQVLRVDEEKRHPVADDVAERVLATLNQRPFPFRGVLLSDYGKGVLTRDVIRAAVEAGRAAGVPVVVDPKGRDYSIYRGVDLLTPNREEAETATGIAIGGLDDLRRVAVRMREITGVRTVTVTLGKDGIFFETEAGEAHVIPTEARAVFDVTGAGDTVISVLTLTQAAGLPIADSLRLANVAAGVVVGRFGTWAVSRREMLEVMGHRAPGKILERAEAVSVAARLRVEGKRLVFTNGCFDIVHSGHTQYLQRARDYGDALMVAVNSDASVQRQGKGADRPINPLAERMVVLAALQSVDFVVPFDEDTPHDLIREVTPHVLAKGEDWRDKGVVGREWVEAHGGQVVLVPLVPGRSTSAVIERIRGGAG